MILFVLEHILYRAHTKTRNSNRNGYVDRKCYFNNYVLMSGSFNYIAVQPFFATITVYVYPDR